MSWLLSSTRDRAGPSGLRDSDVAETIISFGYPAMSKAVVTDGVAAQCLPDA